MNPTLEVIKSRRTTRKFEETQVSDDVLNKIIEAGLFAPSAHNNQPWHFAVVQNSEILSELNTGAKNVAMNFDDEGIKKMMSNEKFNIFYNAPTVIIVSGRDSAMMPEVDCAAATQNMLLAAESMDIGACWNGLVSFALKGPNAEGFKETLSIPEGYSSYYAVALGHKAARATNAPARVENTFTFIR